MAEVRIGFDHGLGDCVNFAQSLPLYVRRGHQVTVCCQPDKAFVFLASGATVAPLRKKCQEIAWPEPPPLSEPTTDIAVCNKPAHNLGRPPMPPIGDPRLLWEELIEVRLNVRERIDRATQSAVDEFISPLARPIVLLHSVGNTFQSTKSLSPVLTSHLYRDVLDAMDGTLVLLDWDNRVPRLAHYRVRHIGDDWGHINVPALVCLIDASDLLIGIDSGPFHVARFTDTPTLGVFADPFHHPARVTLPHPRQICLVPGDSLKEWNKRARVPYNIVQWEGPLTSAFIASYAERILAGPRYLDSAHLGADIQLQHFINDLERGHSDDGELYVDRHRSYDWLLQAMRRRFNDRPTVVETGCVRADEDWSGAGFSTYLLATFLSVNGGRLISVDNDPANCRFAEQTTNSFRCVKIECSDSVEFLQAWKEPIDVLHLDSMDTYVDGYAQHCLNEVRSALPNLHRMSLVLIDDTHYGARGWRGKGSLAVPWLLDNNWRICYSGHQTILERAE